MTDLHTHILPNVDDGSKNITDSLKYLHMLEKLGFKKAVLTPHFYPDNETSERMLERRDAAVTLLKEKNDTGIELYSGCECYMHEYLFHAADLRPFCISGGRYLMVELSYETSNASKMLDMINKLTAKYEVIPILAHIDRYPYIMKNEKTLNDFLDAGCLCQVNADALLSPFKRGRLLKYLENGCIHFLGTDTHRSVISEKKFNKIRDIVKKHTGKELEDAFLGIDDIVNVK